MENITRVAKVAPGREQTYFWASDHSVLFLRNVQGQPYYAAALLDIHTQTEQPLNALNAILGESMSAIPMHVHYVDETGKQTEPMQVVYPPPPCNLSPDGQWLLWQRRSWRSSTWVAFALDSARQIEWPKQNQVACGDGEPFWMQDNRQWVELIQRYDRNEWRFIQAIIHSLDAPTTSQSIRLTGTAGGLALGVTHENRLLIADYVNDPIREARCFLMELHPQVAVTTEYTISLPVGPTHINQIVLSPQGDRLAWVLGSVLDRENIGFWVSDLKGAQMHQIGSVPVLETRRGPRQEKTGLDWPQELCWRPDGKQLSFLYDGALWTVPSAGL